MTPEQFFSAKRLPLMRPELRQATREGRKRQTRRVCIPRYDDRTPCEHYEPTHCPDGEWIMARHCKHGSEGKRCPCGKPGDIRYMTEPLVRGNCGPMAKDLASYRDDGEDVVMVNGMRLTWRWSKDWLNSIHMPKEAARLFVRLTETSAERIQDISPQDVLAEGIRPASLFGYDCDTAGKKMDELRDLWDSINAARGYGWEKNNFVWVIKWEKIT